jgi:hypothetical protein
MVDDASRVRAGGATKEGDCAEGRRRPAVGCLRRHGLGPLGFDKT